MFLLIPGGGGCPWGPPAKKNAYVFPNGSSSFHASRGGSGRAPASSLRLESGAWSHLAGTFNLHTDRWIHEKRAEKDTCGRCRQRKSSGVSGNVGPCKFIMSRPRVHHLSDIAAMARVLHKHVLIHIIYVHSPVRRLTLDHIKLNQDLKYKVALEGERENLA